MKRSFTIQPGAATVLLLIMAAMLLPWLGETLFNTKGEPREAIVAVSMLDSGNWILPVNYGGDIPYKPPFLAWMIAALAWLLNGGVVNEFIARLPSAIAAIAMVLGGYAWVRRVRGERFALIMSLVAVTSFEIFRAATVCRLDMVLTACMVGALYIMYDLRERQGHFRPLRYLSVVVLLTCASLTKGPVGAMLPCLVMGVYCLLRDDRFFPVFFRLLGICVASLVVPALWYYSAYRIGGEQFHALMMEENLGRLTSTMSYGSHEKPLWYNFVTILLGMLPWTLLALMSLFALRRFVHRPFKPLGLMAATAFVVVFVFYCIPHSKRSVYLLPCYPFMAYGVACLLDGLSGSRVLRAYAWFMAVVAVVAPVAAVYVANSGFAGLDIEPFPLWSYLFLALPVVLGVMWMCCRHSPTGFLLAIICSLWLAYAAAVQPRVLNPKSDHALLPQIEAAAPEGYVYSTPECESSRFYTLNFYMRDRMRLLPDVTAAEELPSGSVVLIAPMHTDTAGVGRYLDMRPLTERSGDSRRPVVIGVRK